MAETAVTASARGIFARGREILPDVLLLVLLTAAVGAAAWTREGNLAWDDADYLRRGLVVAREALGGGLLIEVPAGLYDGFLREQPKPPLLVCWIALSRILTGPQTDLRPLIVLSSAIPFGVLALAVWGVARRHAGATASRLSLLALAASPLSLSYGAQVMTETTLSLAVLAVLYATARALVAPRPSTAAAVGIAIGLAMLAKLTIAMLLPLPALYALARLRRDPRVWDRRVLAAFAIPVLLIAGPWYARNGREAVQFAFFSAHYHQLAEGRDTGEPIGARIEALAMGVVGIPALAAGLLGIVPLFRNHRDENADDATFRTFVRLAGLGAVGGLVILLFTPYFAPRFLGPIWPSLAVGLGASLSRTTGRWPAWRPALSAGLLGIGVLLSARSLAAEPRHQTYWIARALLDDLAGRHGVASLANVGNTPDWNVCKTGLINELRADPAGLFVLNDLSRGTAAERARRLGRLDAVVVLDPSALPPEVVAGAPGLNRAYAEAAAAMASDPRFVCVTDPTDPRLPPVLVHVRREKAARVISPRREGTRRQGFVHME